MTETDWLACADPALMLQFLGAKASARKLRLFACACCRRIWYLLRDERGRTAVEVAEQFADGSAKLEELNTARTAAQAFQQSIRGTAPSDVEIPVGAASAWTAGNPEDAAQAAREAAEAVGLASRAAARNLNREATDTAERTARLAEHKAQCDLVRDIFGNPFREVAIDRDWLVPGVLAIAWAIYDEWAFDRLPLLGQALAEAGCSNRTVLDHCRARGKHARGCWLVDAIQGKK